MGFGEPAGRRFCRALVDRRDDRAVMLEFDHVIFTVADLDAAAERLWSEHGLASVPGGRHPGLGTGNRIVPLDVDYLELMAVVDEEEAEGSPLPAWVRTNSESGDRPAALCLRTDELDEWGRRLGAEPVAMERITPDGERLSWRLVGLEHALMRSGHPFFIEWTVPADRHPARTEAPHRVRPRGIDWVEVSGDAHDLRRLVGDRGIDIRFVDGEPSVTGVAVRTDEGEIVLR